MNESVAKRTCPECGLDYFPKGRGQGCPHCLLRLAMPVEESTPLLSDPLPPPPGLKSRFFADYEIFEEIARGGMGVVYRARQLSLNRQVALKMIQAGHLLSTEARLRFRIEIEAVAQLNHPNIVSLYESGEREGVHYFTMRLVEGGNLGERLQRNRPMRENIALLVKVCRTVHYAHQRGVLHRDLKPSNILIDPHGEPHVADFGLAKSLDQETGFTYSSSILGSPNYMAPEQASGRGGQLTTAVDVHGLGAILYQILTGQPPFQGKTALETIRQVVDTPPVSPRRLNAQVDADLATICLKCLEKRPSDRYDSAEELAKDLERWLEGLAIEARPVGVLGSLWRWSKRHPAVAVLSAALVLSLTGLAAGASLAAVRIRNAERQAVALLRSSLLDQAHLLRISGRMGMRNEVLRLVRDAAALGGPPEFIDQARDELLATLAFTDLEFAPQAPVSTADPGLSVLDGRFERLATMVDGTNLVIRRLADGAELLRQAVGSGPVARVEAFSPDGQCLAIRDGSGLGFWDPQTGELRFATNGPQRAFAFATHAPEVFLQSSRYAVSVRDTQSFRELRRLETEPDAASEPNPAGSAASGWRMLSVSEDGALLAAVHSEENVVELINARTGRRLWRAWTDTAVAAIAWQPVLKRVITAGADGLLEFRRWEDGVTTRYQRLPSPVWSMVLDPSNTLLAAACADRVVRVWNLVAARQVFQFKCDSRNLWFDSEGTRLASVQRGDQVGWLDLSRSSEYQEIIVTRISTEVERCQFGPDGTMVAIGYPNSVDLRRVADARLLAALPVGGLPIFAIDPLGQEIVTSASYGVIHRTLRETSPGMIELAPPQTIVGGPRWRSVAFSGDGQRFFAGNASSNAVFVFDRTLTNCLASLGPHEGVDALAASADGRWVATGSSRGRNIRVWEVDSGAELCAMVVGRPPRMHFSPDGRWLLVHGDAFDLRETAGWSPAPALPFPEGRPMLGAACFSADGRLLAAVVDQIEVQLFDLVAWKSLGRLRGPLERRIYDLHFSPDGRQLAAASGRGRLQIWNLANMRRQLATSKLDWDLPALPEARQENQTKPESIVVR